MVFNKTTIVFFTLAFILGLGGAFLKDAGSHQNVAGILAGGTSVLLMFGIWSMFGAFEKDGQ